MSFFDESYRDWIQTQPGFVSLVDSFLDYFEGCCLCDCGHGCRDWIFDNAAKMLAITKGIRSGLDPDILKAMAHKDPKAFRHDLHEEMWARASAERKSKDAPES